MAGVRRDQLALRQRGQLLAAVGAVAGVRVVGTRGEAEDALEEVGLALEAEALVAGVGQREFAGLTGGLEVFD